VIYAGGSTRLYTVWVDGVQVTNSTAGQGVITAISTMFLARGRAEWQGRMDKQQQPVR